MPDRIQLAASELADHNIAPAPGDEVRVGCNPGTGGREHETVSQELLEKPAAAPPA